MKLTSLTDDVTWKVYRVIWLYFPCCLFQLVSKDLAHLSFCDQGLVLFSMSVTSLRLWACSSHLPRLRAKIIIGQPSRTFATHRGMDFGDSNSQLLNDSPDKRQRSEPKHDTVGPFQLGLSPSALRKGEKVPKWSELSTGGKG